MCMHAYKVFIAVFFTNYSRGKFAVIHIYGLLKSILASFGLSPVFRVLGFLVPDEHNHL